MSVHGVVGFARRSVGFHSPLKKVLDTFSLFYGMIGPGGSAPSSSSSSALQPPGDPINGESGFGDRALPVTVGGHS